MILTVQQALLDKEAMSPGQRKAFCPPFLQSHTVWKRTPAEAVGFWQAASLAIQQKSEPS